MKTAKKTSRSGRESLRSAISCDHGSMHSAGPPSEGTKAPDFTLRSQDGSQVSLNKYRGKWVALYFYVKDRTAWCTAEARGFQHDLKQYTLKNTVILGISVDTVESHNQFCAHDDLTFKLLADDQGQVSARYGSIHDYGGKIGRLAVRNTFLIDPKGIIRKAFLQVIPAKHSTQVLAALTELQQ